MREKGDLGCRPHKTDHGAGEEGEQEEVQLPLSIFLTQDRGNRKVGGGAVYLI